MPPTVCIPVPCTTAITTAGENNRRVIDRCCRTPPGGRAAVASATAWRVALTVCSGYGSKATAAAFGVCVHIELGRYQNFFDTLRYQNCVRYSILDICAASLVY